MTQRTESTREGRRFGDRLLGRLGQVVVIATFLAAALGFVGNTFLKAQQIETNRKDIAEILFWKKDKEKQDHDMFYMTCKMYSKMDRNGTPASCNSVLRTN